MKRVMQALSTCLLAVLLFLIAGCAGAPATLKSAKDKMEKNGYTVTVKEYEKNSTEYEHGLKGILYAYDNKEVLALTAYLFTDPYYAEKKDKELRKASPVKLQTKLVKKWLLVEGTESHHVYAISVFEG